MEEIEDENKIILKKLTCQEGTNNTTNGVMEEERSQEKRTVDDDIFAHFESGIRIRIERFLSTLAFFLSKLHLLQTKKKE